MYLPLSYVLLQERSGDYEEGLNALTELDGAKDSNLRGLEKARSLLERHEEERPALDPATDEALQDFIARREAVLPDGVS